MTTEIILWGVLILPWFTLFLLPQSEVRRYMPVAIFASNIMILYNIFAFHQKHWTINISIIPVLKPLFVSGVLGGFLIVTIWIFHFSYGNLKKYILVNIVADFLFSVFPFHYWFQNILGVYDLVNISKWERWVLFVLFSFVLYLFQKWLEGNKLKDT
ncbi:hypothetical protein [Bacillus sp. 2205SS5-2]|uniref:hypothetical protein n=1 Tax=Bacillus sp. 2205SS5-2 TaxID=3109031 RepID=UPI00300686B0